MFTFVDRAVHSTLPYIFTKRTAMMFLLAIVDRFRQVLC